MFCCVCLGMVCDVYKLFDVLYGQVDGQFKAAWKNYTPCLLSTKSQP